MKYIFIFIVSFFSIALYAGEEDAVATQAAVWESPWRNFSNYFDYNPAATFAVPVRQFSEVGGSYLTSHADKGMHLVQEGDGASALRLYSESFQADSAYRFFGKAYFLNDTKNNVGWRDVEDYSLLSPYVVADSIGGNYKRESYFLSGGASVRLRSTEWGIRGTYQGSVSYRQVDPRPRNTVSVIRINPGVTYFRGNWRYGWFGEYVRYRQNVDIEIEKADRKAYFYLMQGFGIYNRQFSKLDDNFSRIYKANLYSTGFHIDKSEGEQSTGALVALKRAIVTVDESDRRTPYRLTHSDVRAQLTHERQLLGQNLFMKAIYSFHQSVGNETQYTPVIVNTTSVVWKYATQSDRYKDLTHNVQFSALLADKDLSRFSVWEQVDGGWQDARQYYYSPDYHQFVQDAVGSATLGVNCPLKKYTVVGSLKAGYKKNLSSSLLQNENNLISSQLIVPDYTFLKSDVAFYQLNARIRFRVSATVWANVSAEAGLQTSKDKQAFSTDFHINLNF